jgi:hypothetical protein
MKFTGTNNHAVRTARLEGKPGRRLSGLVAALVVSAGDFWEIGDTGGEGGIPPVEI